MTVVPQRYPMARAVAALVYERFASGADHAALIPDTQTIEEIIDVAFWASLRREEGHSRRISMSYLPQERADTTVRFARPLRFDAPTLTKLAPAVERPGIHLLIERRSGELHVWGTTRHIPPGSFVLEVVQPALLVVKRPRDDASRKYANIVVLEGDEVKVIPDERASATDRHPLIAHLLTLDSERSWSDPANVTIQLATSMRAHGRGGSLLIVPATSSGWQESVVNPIAYEMVPPYREIPSLLEQQPEPRDELLWRERLRRAVDLVAGMTAVDGAAVINDHYDLLAFGVKIQRRRDREPIQQVLATRISDGSSAGMTNVADLGGTRHLSAAQFVHDQPDAMALVASQDGNFTAFTSLPGEATVLAYRVEILLL